MTGYTGSDIYCYRIIPRKVDIEVIKETDTILAYYHTKPFWPTHIVVTPKAHVDSILELESPLTEELLAVVQEVAREVRIAWAPSVFKPISVNIKTQSIFMCM